MPVLSLCLFTCDWSCRRIKQLLSDLSFNLRVIASIAITLGPPTSHAWKVTDARGAIGAVDWDNIKCI